MMKQQQKCAFCKSAPVERPFAPFCSARCKTNDLGAWASEKYRVSGSEIEDAGETSEGEDDRTDRELASASRRIKASALH